MKVLKKSVDVCDEKSPRACLEVVLVLMLVCGCVGVFGLARCEEEVE